MGSSQAQDYKQEINLLIDKIHDENYRIMKIEIKAQDENGIQLVLDEDIADFEGLKKCLKVYIIP